MPKLVCLRRGGYRGGAQNLKVAQSETFEVGDEEAARLLDEFPRWFKKESALKKVKDALTGKEE